MTTNNSPEAILTYLQRIPRYPYSKKIDPEFVDELAEDFAALPIISELKAFRWFYDNDPVGRLSNVRVALRRWLESAPERRRNRTPRKPLPQASRKSEPAK